jgi:hypothetical protein
MNDFEANRQARAERFRELAEKHDNISTGRHLAAAMPSLTPLAQGVDALANRGAQ